MNNDITVKALIKIMKEQKKQKEDLDYLIEAVNLLLDIQKNNSNKQQK